MVTAVDWYLLEKEYQSSVAREREFKSLKQVLEGKARYSSNKAKASRLTSEPWDEKKTTEEEKEADFPLFIINK